MSDINTKISNLSMEFSIQKQSSKQLKFSYYSTEDLRNNLLKLLNKYKLAFSATQKKLKVEYHSVNDKTVCTAIVKFKYRLMDINTGQFIDYNWYGQATDYGDGGKATSKSITSCLKSWIVTTFMVSEHEPMTKDLFFQELEKEGIGKEEFKNGMRILGREKLLITELEIVFNEIVGIKHLLGKITISEQQKSKWFDLEKTSYPLWKIAEYVVENSTNYHTTWPNPALGGLDLEITKEKLDKFYLNGVA